MTSTSSQLNPRWRRIAAAAVVALGGAFVSPAAAGERCGACDSGERAAAHPVTVAARQQPKRDGDDDGDQRRRGDDNDRGNDREGKERRGGDGRWGYGGPFDMGWANDGRGHGDMRAPQPQEWTEAQSFLFEHSPRRQRALDQLSEGGKKEWIKKYIFARYRSLKRLEKRDPTGYERRLGQLAIEDQIFGLVSDWGAAGDDRREALRQSLRTEVTRLVDLDLEERRRRVESLQRELNEQAQALKNDEKERDALVEKRVGRFVEWANRWAARKTKQGEGDQPQAPEEGSQKKPD
jgi:hypothetical protein